MAATIEDLLYSRMVEFPALTENLARHNRKPAVFYQKAPDDTAKGWYGDLQYPRIDFTVDMQANPERQSSGQVVINVWCSISGVLPEEIEPSVRVALCGVFMTPDEDSPYCLAWQRTDPFEENTNNAEEGGLVIGTTIIFDIFAFPSSVTSDPDPILAINHWAKELEPKISVIGYDKLPSYFTPQANAPAFYFRVVSMETAEETNTVAWMHCTIAGHVFAPTVADQLQWIRYIADTLAISGEVTMLDTSPMLLRALRADTSLDPLSQGQIRMQVRFGILRQWSYAHPLQQITITGGY
jgi:hypothetical protein